MSAFSCGALAGLLTIACSVGITLSPNLQDIHRKKALVVFPFHQVCSRNKRRCLDRSHSVLVTAIRRRIVCIASASASFATESTFPSTPASATTRSYCLYSRRNFFR
ncbi:hypothetical protein PR001_g21656 [Phytophthora rubi]|uniref:RxLR effector protein n=1 Tax=Phytophthora rubi TaxID=129364 RepID=A0A6A3J7F5_9STRA|nr:hypothetical protein PR002_g21814 [Phytophthora rubi]KAE8989857.1 hypothetical protein PR001_g21656 [Phytophthora rubi]